MTSDGFTENRRAIGRRSVLALAALGLLSLVEGCSTGSETPALATETRTLLPTLQIESEKRVPLYTMTGFRPRPAVIEGFKVYNTAPSGIDLASWRLRVDGLVSRPLEYDIQDILAFEPVVMTKAFVCGSYWSVENVRWQGIRMKPLLDAADVAPEAKSVKIYSMDGRSITPLSLSAARGQGVLLAYGANDEALAEDQGYPLRLVVPLMIGIWNTKWINRIELVAEEHRDIFDARDSRQSEGTRSD